MAKTGLSDETILKIKTKRARLSCRKKNDLKSFNLYEFLKHQNAHSFNVPFFLADQDTYKNAHINFPFRTFTYGLGITYSGGGDVFKIGSADYILKAASLTTVGPGLVCNWTGNYTAKHDTVYFTEELFCRSVKEFLL